MVNLSLGVATVDITPDPGLHLAGFAARNLPSTGIHDRLSARAVVVNDTAIVVADVIGLHEDMAQRIRERCTLPADNVIVCATHTHGAPVSMLNRLGVDANPDFLQKLEDGCVLAIDRAAASARPGKLSFGLGLDPDVARNRRHAAGVVDRALPVLRLRDDAGALVAVIVSYACHPTVLGADNLEITADFPHFVRKRIEADNPGALAIYLNGCTGDANIGHSAQASWSTAASVNRSFENARRLGDRIAAAAMAAPEFPAGTTVYAQNRRVELDLERREGDLASVKSAWQKELDAADPTRKILLEHWIAWAGRFDKIPPAVGTVALPVLIGVGSPSSRSQARFLRKPRCTCAQAALGRPALCSHMPRERLAIFHHDPHTRVAATKSRKRTVSLACQDHLPRVPQSVWQTARYPSSPGLIERQRPNFRS
ncbi:neutral/alkaline non-lysosomal ceramidase N-terminal domain-containing protein [Devosia rhodophyticola]|uniref:Neutral/alkaline non-lysosomal ceramidase N-terminal domain-containing protein n=1 Tax=Devosia rhodophyticola TaxID=3026423 RepID=A0ABY7Z1S5_9HYPH|nr:neutral/alkaline non-lysosomal ceramidase N-terminal domain-containing protein [Devosia rhodophyticola]WDR07243.1 neutral/alkaline non-lysosomal ceramidase N-terminal domain-containing protein [Devosia rhodophyticola]